MKIARNAHTRSSSAASADGTAPSGVFDVPVTPEDVSEQPGSARAGQAQRGILFVLVSAVAFGAMPVFAKLAYSAGMDLKTLLALRFSLAAIGMWLIWAWLSLRGGQKPPGLRAIPPLIIMGAVGYVGQSF